MSSDGGLVVSLEDLHIPLEFGHRVHSDGVQVGKPGDVTEQILDRVVYEGLALAERLHGEDAQAAIVGPPNRYFLLGQPAALQMVASLVDDAERSTEWASPSSSTPAGPSSLAV